MSLVASRVGLTHRCTIERDVAPLDEAWGQPGAPDWQLHLDDVPCRAWVDAAREPVDTERTVVLGDRRVIVPLGTDVTERDRIGQVSERGEEILEGPMGIEAVVRRRTHLELVVQRIR